MLTHDDKNMMGGLAMKPISQIFSQQRCSNCWAPLASNPHECSNCHERDFVKIQHPPLTFGIILFFALFIFVFFILPQF